MAFIFALFIRWIEWFSPVIHLCFPDLLGRESNGLRSTQSASNSLRITYKRVIKINKFRNPIHTPLSITWYVSSNTLHLIRNYSFYIIASWFFLVFSTVASYSSQEQLLFIFILLFYHLSTTDNFMLQHLSTSCHVYCHSHWREIWSNRTFIFPYNTTVTTLWRMRLEEEGVRALKRRLGL